ncbi:MAG TPA: 50S ribosomal protein L3 [Planctomycetaceae bacterium]|nr:50S ribosomal protein L3 [Planctomycetaceae bacterium]
MRIGILGRKVGMTQVYDAEGNLHAVTVIEAGPCTVLALRTKERDGYEAVQLGFADKKRKQASRAERGQVANLDGHRQKRRAAQGLPAVAKANCEPKRFIREFRTDGEPHGLEVGAEVKVSILNEVPRVDLIGLTKGRGFAGVMKRHNFQGQGASHGVKRVHRHGGSSGPSADPSRVFRGKRMGGRYGGERVTMRNISIFKLDAETNTLLVEGAVPGPSGGWVIIRPTKKHAKKGHKA